MDRQVETMVSVLTSDHPQWIRAVAWVGRLQEDDGSPAESDIYLNRVICWKDGGVVAEYYTGFDDYEAYRAIAEASKDVEWTQFRLVADRDGERQVRFVTDEPRRLAEGAATDNYWRQVHDYAQLNGDDLETLVRRLRSTGDLPGGKNKSRRGVLGYFRPGA
ncbi:hypothetical protein [Serinicoccus hydrothermalis]|uniref:hypothetical protein n=1 Tax=Serinicoccus hydrothermalis TaxID=1758689 RepID=UPI0012FA55CA|nr:hypothetical protein [Serinicoccus hydrothermalis]